MKKTYHKPEMQLAECLLPKSFLSASFNVKDEDVDNADKAGRRELPLAESDDWSSFMDE
ncbi:MAG: hypothetical protein J1F06_06180 [Prevotellaceae bacterium]|nr:hypothetical protein [Prevotellaceae bacterium]